MLKWYSIIVTCLCIVLGIYKSVEDKEAGLLDVVLTLLIYVPVLIYLLF